MQSGLAISLVPLSRSRELMSFEEGQQELRGGGCLVKIVLENSIKFPMADAMLTLTCCKTECAHPDRGGGGKQRADSMTKSVRFSVLQPT